MLSRLTGRTGTTALGAALILLGQFGPSSRTASAATLTVPPGSIVFSHEESPSTVAAQQYSNLYTLDPQSGASARLTNFAFPVRASMPSWSRDFRKLSFSSNLSGVDSQEAASVYTIDRSGKNLREISGPGIITPLPLGTATVTGRVDAPPQASLGTGTIVSCSITAEGAPNNSVDCGNDASAGRPFTLSHVPDGAQWIRIQAEVSYQNSLGSPGTSLAFATICVPCGQTNVGTVYPAPTQTLSVLPAWSGDNTQLVMTHILEGRRLSGGGWQPFANGDITVWTSSGGFVREIVNPVNPAGAVIPVGIGGADWSPAANQLCFAANDSASATDSWLYLSDPTGANAVPIYKVPDITPQNLLPYSKVTSCRWSASGDQIAFVELHQNSFGFWWSDLYAINVASKAVHPLTNCAPKTLSNGLFCDAPAWSPDESAVAFQGSVAPGVDLNPPSGSDIYAVDAGATSIARLTTDGRSSYPTWGASQTAPPLPAVPGAAVRAASPALAPAPAVALNRLLPPPLPPGPRGPRSQQPSVGPALVAEPIRAADAGGFSVPDGSVRLALTALRALASLLTG